MNTKSEISRVIESKKIARLLRKFAHLIGKLSESELDDLIEGRSYFQVVPSKSIGLHRRPRTVESRQCADYSRIALQLRECPSRSEGINLLTKLAPSKVSVEGIARHLDLPVHRSDTIGRLQERIVESEIGSKLRSEAVQGKKL